MKRILLAGTAALSLLTGPALAQSFADQVVAGLQTQGFTRIEVKQGPTQLKVEAVNGDTKVEYVYDLATGDLLRQETERVEAGDDTAPGVEIDREEEDFVSVPGAVMDDDGDDEDDDEDDKDHNRGHGNDDDHDDGDNPGRSGGDDGDDDEDHDRGHGNDDDRDDDDNSGRGGRDDDHDDDHGDDRDDD